MNIMLIDKFTRFVLLVAGINIFQKAVAFHYEIFLFITKGLKQ